jgi:hypothetical protein
MVGFMLALALFLSVGVYFNNNSSVRWSFLLYVAFPIFAGVIIFARLPKLTRKILTIDKTGIKITSDGKSIAYDWSDLAGASAARAKVSTHGSMEWASSDARNFVILTMKNKLSDLYAPIVIGEEFGISVENMASIIRDGIDKWGFATAAK